MKICTGCKLKLPVTSFVWKVKGVRRVTRCRACQKIVSDRHYQSNKREYVLRARKYRKEVVGGWLREYKSNHPCKDCGKFYHYCQMDFDHLRDKTRSVNGMISASGKQRLLAEIAKCDLVCANCHRLRTFRRLRAADTPCGREPAFNPVEVGSTPTSATAGGSRRSANKKGGAL